MRLREFCCFLDYVNFGTSYRKRQGGNVLRSPAILLFELRKRPTFALLSSQNRRFNFLAIKHNCEKITTSYDKCWTTNA